MNRISTFFLTLCACVFPLMAQEYTLVWNEDFTEAELDRNVWNVEVNGDGGGNNELQYYCEKGVSLGVDPVEGKHCLILTATKENYSGKKCTSGRVNSLGKTYYRYGKIEARIKFPNTANGLWPAFWQMGNDFKQVGWPKCGETDIIELGHQNAFSKGTQDRYFNGALHLGSAWNSVWSDAQSTTYAYSVEDTFHIISMEWTPTSIDMYVDKDTHPGVKPYFHANLEPNKDHDNNYDRQVVFGKDQFIIFNLAVGGNFPGIFDINNITALSDGPAKMYIDWVRVYQRGDDNQTAHFSSASDPIEGASSSTAVEDVLSEQQTTKIFRNGQIVIIKNGVEYNLLGEVIR